MTALTWSSDGPISTIWLDGPTRRNALGSAAWNAFPDMLARAESDPECRVIIVRGRGGYFGAGADIHEFDRVFATPESTLEYFGAMEAAMRAVEDVGKSTIAAVEGLCIGACVALALACDIRLGSADSSYAITPAKLGIAYPYGDIGRVVAAIGAGRAKSMIFSGRSVSAGNALALGLIDMVADEDFDLSLSRFATAISECSPWTIAKTRRAVAVAQLGGSSADAGYPDILVEAVSGPDFAEGMAAFAAKRRPVFG